MPTECISDLFGFARVESRRVEAAFDGGAVTSNGGALLLGATERAIGLVAGFARCFQDGRDPALTEHSVATLVGQRVFALALGYEDLIDHDELRHDPVMAVLAGKLEARRADCAPLAGKSTLNRLEHAPSGAPSRYHKIGHDAAAIERQFVALFLAAHRRPAKQIIIDLDATDDPLHGEQEDRFFHGYYDCYCYLPLYILAGVGLPGAQRPRRWPQAAADDPARRVSGPGHAGASVCGGRAHRARHCRHGARRAGPGRGRGGADTRLSPDAVGTRSPARRFACSPACLSGPESPSVLARMGRRGTRWTRLH